MKWLVNFALAVVASVCAIGAYQYYTTDMQPLRQQLLLVDTEARKVVDLSREETKRLQILRGGQPTAAPSVSALTATPSPGANEYDRCVLVKTKNVYRLAPGDCYIFDDVDGDFSKPSSVIGGVWISGAPGWRSVWPTPGATPWSWAATAGMSVL